MAVIEILKKFALFLVMTMVVTVMYAHTGALTYERSIGRSFLTALDDLVPFIPAMVLPYLSIHLFWVPLILAPKRILPLQSFARIAAANGIAFTTAMVIHFIVPAFYAHPTLPLHCTWVETLLGYVYHFDYANNTFPSTHVTVVMVVLASIPRRFPKPLFLLQCVWGTAIITSTVLVKQHYVADVIGGALLGAGVVALMDRLYPESTSAS